MLGPSCWTKAQLITCTSRNIKLSFSTPSSESGTRPTGELQPQKLHRHRLLGAPRGQERYRGERAASGSTASHLPGSVSPTCVPLPSGPGVSREPFKASPRSREVEPCESRRRAGASRGHPNRRRPRPDPGRREPGGAAGAEPLSLGSAGRPGRRGCGRACAMDGGAARPGSELLSFARFLDSSAQRLSYGYGRRSLSELREREFGRLAGGAGGERRAGGSQTLPGWSGAVSADPETGHLRCYPQPQAPLAARAIGLSGLHLSHPLPGRVGRLAFSACARGSAGTRLAAATSTVEAGARPGAERGRPGRRVRLRVCGLAWLFSSEHSWDGLPSGFAFWLFKKPVPLIS